MSKIKTGSRSPLLPDVVNTKSRAKKSVRVLSLTQMANLSRTGPV